MPEQKLAQSESQAGKSPRDGADVGHATSVDACHKMSQEASDSMRDARARDSKSNQPKDDGPSLKELLWDMFIFG